MASTAVTLPSSGVPFPVANTSATAARRCLLLPSRLPRRALRVVASAATEAPPITPPPTSPSGIVLVDPAEAQKVHRLKAVYDQKVVPLITEEFGYSNVHQVPKLEKIVVNCGLGADAGNSKGLEAAMKDLANITGQWPVKTKAKKSVASFKIREGNTIGIAVTLRGRIMYNFLDRLINLGLPRTMDFLGVNPNSFDGHGNYSIGLRDQGVFPEIPYEVGGKKNGMDVTIVTSAKTDNEAFRLLALLGMPFSENIKQDLVIRKKRLKRHHFLSKGKGKGGRR
ncbi:50S ribosomal protein L5, chloroplastic [Dichanthelium oligosanthes]|uniref:Large ribosomal subunit protein uL5c n=1 Tax=Dichanthelium oligosanthes TaxID=888268 RepID=A0A1E5UV48_9POAL|nr:50S ribosomal protein L5, chloroplastic [Dichanthelium oligosanthes]